MNREYPLAVVLFAVLGKYEGHRFFGLLFDLHLNFELINKTYLICHITYPTLSADSFYPV